LRASSKAAKYVFWAEDIDFTSWQVFSRYFTFDEHAVSAAHRYVLSAWAQVSLVVHLHAVTIAAIAESTPSLVSQEMKLLVPVDETPEPEVVVVPEPEPWVAVDETPEPELWPVEVPEPLPEV